MNLSSVGCSMGELSSNPAFADYNPLEGLSKVILSVPVLDL